MLTRLSSSFLSMPALFAALSGAATPAEAQAPGDTVWATPTQRYDAGAIHRFFMGSGHRDLWPIEVRAEVLDLDTFAGGLTVDRLGGGLQTTSMRLAGADGYTYVFRSIDKDVSRSLDPLLQETLVDRALQDRIGFLFPLSAMVVEPLLTAAGVLHARPTLVVMPDDPRLGEFREQFADLLGWIEVRPNELEDGAGDEGGGIYRDSSRIALADRIIGSPRFLERIEDGPEDRPDAEAFLRARLLDVLVGDWDRHPDQWRWAGFEQDGVQMFEPIPRDRDWALSRMDGAYMVFLELYPNLLPHLRGFGYDYPPAFNATWSARTLDRRILPALSRDRWRRVAQAVTDRLTNEVIEAAVAQLPQGYFDEIGEELTSSLKNRRDQLNQFAEEFYEVLAGWVDIRATDEPDLALIEGLDSSRVRVSLSSLESPDTEPYYARVFHPEETREIRIFLHGDDDEAVIRGNPIDAITVRIIGGGSDDTCALETQRDGAVKLYDSRGDNRVAPGTEISIDESDWEDPVDPSENTHQAGTRDWGSDFAFFPTLAFDSDGGLFVEAGAIRAGYGFRQAPYKSRLSLYAGYMTGTNGVRFAGSYEFPLVGRDWRNGIEVLATGAGLDRFYGFGNETLFDRLLDRFEARRNEFTVSWDVEYMGWEEVKVSAGPFWRAIRPLSNEGTLIEELQPFGYEDFDEAGLDASFVWDGRDDPLTPRRGAALELDARWVPSILDAEESFRRVRAVGKGYLSSDGFLKPTLAFRLGAEKVWGTPPYFESPVLGGAQSLRGFRNQRFTGEESAFLNTELRLHLGDAMILLPAELGVVGLSDVGRVWVDGEDSDDWHSAFGGGIWVDFFKRFTMTLAIASSSEQTGFYFSSGFLF